jgi:hypothetical protein
VEGDASALFGLLESAVIQCRVRWRATPVVIMQVADAYGCPRCGVVVGGKPFDVPESPIENVPFGERPLVVIWRERRYRCSEPACPQNLFVQRRDEIQAEATLP